MIWTSRAVLTGSMSESPSPDSEKKTMRELFKEKLQSVSRPVPRLGPFSWRMEQLTYRNFKS